MASGKSSRLRLSAADTGEIHKLLVQQTEQRESREWLVDKATRYLVDRHPPELRERIQKLKWIELYHLAMGHDSRGGLQRKLSANRTKTPRLSQSPPAPGSFDSLLVQEIRLRAGLLACAQMAYSLRGEYTRALEDIVLVPGYAEAKSAAVGPALFGPARPTCGNGDSGAVPGDRSMRKELDELIAAAARRGLDATLVLTGVSTLVELASQELLAPALSRTGSTGVYKEPPPRKRRRDASASSNTSPSSSSQSSESSSSGESEQPARKRRRDA